MAEAKNKISVDQWAKYCWCPNKSDSVSFFPWDVTVGGFRDHERGFEAGQKTAMWGKCLECSTEMWRCFGNAMMLFKYGFPADFPINKPVNEWLLPRWLFSWLLHQCQPAAPRTSTIPSPGNKTRTTCCPSRVGPGFRTAQDLGSAAG